jgi:hypothetical protein
LKQLDTGLEARLANVILEGRHAARLEHTDDPPLVCNENAEVLSPNEVPLEREVADGASDGDRAYREFFGKLRGTGRAPNRAMMPSPITRLTVPS